ncbi:MAG: carboxylating nicotinate-nucleotide diphosphorylase [Deltaproteobacteria bacterium]|nr:carboxylating nicotinate-nucleotide diphosphorylase [Deltaproteobacteria bacterium]
MLLSLPPQVIQQAAASALAEDAPWGDVTSQAFLPPGARGRLAVRFRQAGVAAGLPVAKEVFAQAAPGMTWLDGDGQTENQGDCRWEGQPVTAGQVVATVEGPLAGLLLGERSALNFMQRLSGIATLTAEYVNAVGEVSPHPRVAATRKTTPGLRALEKYAVTAGGGLPHRFGLSDGVLVKDNHWAALRAGGMTLAQAVSRAQEQLPHGLMIQVEVETEAEAREAMEAGAHSLLLDNMPPEEMRRVVVMVRDWQGRGVLVEASGRMTLDKARAAAEAGVDIISVGALTHSAPALDIGLDWDL